MHLWAVGAGAGVGHGALARNRPLAKGRGCCSCSEPAAPGLSAMCNQNQPFPITRGRSEHQRFPQGNLEDKMGCEAETASAPSAGAATDSPRSQSCMCTNQSTVNYGETLTSSGIGLDDTFEREMCAFFDHILRDEPLEAATVKQAQQKLAPIKSALKSREAQRRKSRYTSGRRVTFKLPAAPAKSHRCIS